MAGLQLGVVAAGHPLTAGAGADVLRDGGNAVDAALGAMLASFACEPLLTGLGAGGYMLVVGPDGCADAAGLLRRGARIAAPIPRPGGELVPIDVSFGDADQVFNIGAGVGRRPTACPPGCARRRPGSAGCRWPSWWRPAARLARDGVELNPAQAYVIEILAGIVTATPECRALFAPGGRVLRAGEQIRQPELADALERLGAEGVGAVLHRATSPPRSSSG